MKQKAFSVIYQLASLSFILSSHLVRGAETSTMLTGANAISIFPLDGSSDPALSIVQGNYNPVTYVKTNSFSITLFLITLSETKDISTIFLQMGEDRTTPIDRTLQSDITISIGLSSSSLVPCATGVNDGGFYSCAGGAKSGTFIQIRNTHSPAASFSLNAVRLYQGAIATGLATLEQESILQSTATMTSNNLLLNNPRSSAYDINALG